MGNPAITLIGALTTDEAEGAPPGRIEPPIGVLTLAAVLGTRHVPATVIDLNSVWRRAGYSANRLFEITLAAVRRETPHVIGLSTISSTYPLTLRLAAELKREFPRAVLLLGGPQASVVDEATLRTFPFIDFVLRGEAEDTLPPFLEQVLAGRSPEHVEGLTFRGPFGITRNPNASPILNLDQVPLPSFDSYPDVRQWPAMPLEIGRGCPFSCRFCSTNDFFRRKFRLKSAAHVIEQMELLSGRYGVNAFELIHDMFTVDRKRVVEFCESLLAINTPFTWSCSARTDCVDPELLDLMKRSGCCGIFFGIETGSPRLQTIIDKELDLPQARSILDCADRKGLETTASLIIGYPQETFEDLRQTISFYGDAVRLDHSDPQLHLLSPLAGTPLETEFRSQLVFEDVDSDIQDFGQGQGQAERALISAHPEIFQNFYSFPCSTDRSFLRQLSDFFINLSRRCKGLIVALHTEGLSLLDVFGSWYEEMKSKNLDSEYYRGAPFLADFLAFAHGRYVNHGRVAIDVMWRFYDTLRIHLSSRPCATPVGEDVRGSEDLDTRKVNLRSGVIILAVQGDVVQVLQSLRDSHIPDPQCANPITTISIRPSRNDRLIVGSVPPLASAIFGNLNGGNTVSGIIAGLTRDSVKIGVLEPAQFVPPALNILERDGFVTVGAGF